MNAIEFAGQIGAGGTITVPSEIAAQVPEGSSIKVIVMWDASEDEDAWRALSMEGLARSYAPEDEIYERLVDEPPTR